MGQWWVTDHLEVFANGKIIITSWVVWVIVSITLHELSHGWMAIRCGDDIPIRTGHMTFNPLVHIPPMAWLMFALFGFTWGLMPVQPNNFRGRYDDAKVAFAGPAMNLTLFLVCIIADLLWLKVAARVGDPLGQNFHTFFFEGARINMMGFLFNLIPIPPLDGSRIVGDFFPQYRRLWQGQGSVVAIVIAVLMFTVGGRYAWRVADHATIYVLGNGVRATGVAWLDPYIPN